MSEKRKDKKGRILRNGESQRKDGTYQFRYSDIRGKRQYIYAPTLDELRKKEQEVQRDLSDGIDYSAGEITVLELVKRYVSQKRGVSSGTRSNYRMVINLLSKDDFGGRQIRTVKMSDCKMFLIKLHDAGRSYGTIKQIQSIIKPAFKTAVMDDILRRNPFVFTLKDVIPNDTKKREALTPDEVDRFLRYVQDGAYSYKYYDEIIILLGTGLRSSELCGLTKKDMWLSL